MALVVEDGTGREDANSFASVEQLTEYCADRELTVPANPAAKLIAATDWIVANVPEWRGVQLMGNQGLPWPRVGITDPQTGVDYVAPWLPAQLIKATCVLAMEAASGALYNKADPASPQVIERTVGPLTTKYNPQNPQERVTQRRFVEVDGLLAPWISSGGFTLTVGRY